MTLKQEGGLPLIDSLGRPLRFYLYQMKHHRFCLGERSDRSLIDTFANPEDGIKVKQQLKDRRGRIRRIFRL